MNIYSNVKARMAIADGWDKVPRPEAIQPRPYQDYTVTPMFGPPQLVVVVERPLSVGVAYLLWLFLGLFGAHYFYMGKVGIGVLYLLTLGFAGVGLLIDLFTLKGQVDRENARRRY